MSDLVDEYVILKPEFWDTEIQGTILDRFGNPDPDSFSRMPDMDYISHGNKYAELTPRVGYVTRLQNGKAIVQTSFYFPRHRHGDYEVLDPSMLTTFKVLLRPDADVDPEGVLGAPEERRFGAIVDSNDGDDMNEMFTVMEMKSGYEQEYSIHKLIFIEDSLYDALMAAAPLPLVSKQGFLPTHVGTKEIPQNIESIVFSQLSGLHPKYKPANVLQMVEDRLYGPPQTIELEPPPKPNLLNALNSGPLPYGPTEMNFVGGSNSNSDRRGENIYYEMLEEHGPNYWNELVEEDAYENSLAEEEKMQSVSKRGTLEHLPVPFNVQRVIHSMVTGVPSSVGASMKPSNTETLEERGMRYLRRRGPYNKNNSKYNENLAESGVNTGPLPRGPVESNFQGGSRKSLRKIGTQMARRGTRRSRGLFSRIYSPVGHLLAAGKESVGAVTNTAKGVVGEGIKGLDKIGRSVSTHANQAVSNVFTRKGGKRRGSRKSRKSRRTTRRRR